MKRLLLILLITALVLTGCTVTKIEEKTAQEVADYKESTQKVETEKSEDVDTTEEADTTEGAKSEESSDESEKKDVSKMPTLPDMEFEGLTFKEDGYEIVEFKSLADGDTANFVVGGMTMACRFLAIDTPETSGTTGLQPWALAGKEFTKNALENAEVIIIEKDIESDVIDKYGRLLGWIWVDGELLNYQLVEEGLAWVKYLYGDYKYTAEMITVESRVQKTKVKIWGEDDPSYDYENAVKEVSIAEAKKLSVGSNVKIKGIVTNIIGQNAFITDGTASIYIYANRYNYSGLKKTGNEIELTGKLIEYNGLSEISSIEDNKITILSEGNEVVATTVMIDDIGEELEGDFVRLEDMTIESIYISEGGGYDIKVKKDNRYMTVRIDKYLEDYPDPETLEVGSVIDVEGSVSQYLENYQVMIKDSTSITFK